jgi:hypothetical protein
VGHIQLKRSSVDTTGRGGDAAQIKAAAADRSVITDRGLRSLRRSCSSKEKRYSKKKNKGTRAEREAWNERIYGNDCRLRQPQRAIRSCRMESSSASIDPVRAVWVHSPSATDS